MVFLFKQVIFRFQPFIFQGVAVFFEGPTTPSYQPNTIPWKERPLTVADKLAEATAPKDHEKTIKPKRGRQTGTGPTTTKADAAQVFFWIKDVSKGGGIDIKGNWGWNWLEASDFLIFFGAYGPSMFGWNKFQGGKRCRFENLLIVVWRLEWKMWKGLHVETPISSKQFHSLIALIMIMLLLDRPSDLQKPGDKFSFLALEKKLHTTRDLRRVLLLKRCSLHTAWAYFPWRGPMLASVTMVFECTVVLYHAKMKNRCMNKT